MRPRLYEAFCYDNFAAIIPHDLDDWFLGHENPEGLKETSVLYEKVHVNQFLASNFLKEYGEQYIYEGIPVLISKDIMYLETADIYNDWTWWDRLKVGL